MAFVRLLLSSHFFTGDWRHMTVVHSVDLQHPYLKEKFPKLHTTKMPTKVGEINVLSFLKMLILFGYVFFHVYWHGH